MMSDEFMWHTAQCSLLYHPYCCRMELLLCGRLDVEGSDAALCIVLDSPCYLLLHTSLYSMRILIVMVVVVVVTMLTMLTILTV